MISKIFSIDRDVLQEYINKSDCISSVLDKLDISRTSSISRTNLKQRIDDDELDISLMSGRNQFNSDGSKRRLTKSGVVYECVLCGLSDWQREKITLHLDHIDSDRRNNTRDNLRLLCPNCHSQTPTYCGRNKSGAVDIKYDTRVVYSCKDCGVVRSATKAERCLECENKLNRLKSNIPWDAQELLELIKYNSMVKIGHMFGVSDNAIRKRCRVLGIDLKLAKNSHNK